MNHQIVVIYKFDLNNEVSEKQLVDASAKLDEQLLGFSGFQYRSLTKAEDGKWLDIIYWENEESSKSAELMLNEKDMAAFMGLLKEGSVSRTLAKAYSSVYPEMSAA